MTPETALALVLAFTPSPQPAQPAVMKYATVTKVETTYRSPVGHTHTCPRCGTTFDHAATAGHNCPKCGTQVFVQDRTPRMVTVTRTVQTKVPSPESPPAPQQPVAAATPAYVLPQASSACANGQCSTISRRFR